MLNDYLFNGNIWLIIGLVCLLLELVDGSLVIFLPTGISGLIVGAILKLQESNILPVIIIDLVWTLVVWSVLSLAISLLIRHYYKPKKTEQDINTY